MVRTLLVKITAVGLVLALAVGLVDAGLDRSWDQFALFAISGGLAVILAIPLFGRRPVLSLRHDLVTWLTHRSQLTGEPVERIADRAVATYRTQLGANEHGS
jgi:hypothetical protein